MKFDIGQGSKLYDYMLQNHEKTPNAREYHDEDQLLHMTPPSLFIYERNYFCAFTSSSAHQFVPNIYLQGIGEESENNKEAIEMKGGEIFIDFIPELNQNGTGYLCYLTDEQFVENDFATDDEIKENLMHMETTATTVIVRKLVDLYSRKSSHNQNVGRFRSEELSMSLSRQKNWIKWVMPLKYDGQELVEFAVCK